MGQAYPDCGEFTTFSIRCESGATEGHTNRQIPHDCHRLNCPICFSAEIWRRARAAADRLSQVKKELYLKGVDSDYVEFIIQPPKELSQEYFGTVEGYAKMCHQVKTIMEDNGVIAGVKFIHTTATNRAQGASYKEYEKYRAGDPTARIRWNPHIQGVGIRRQDWGVRKERQAAWRAKGWFVKLLYQDGRTGNRAWKSVARKISYELSHADTGVMENGHKKTFTTWFGGAAYNNVVKTENVKLTKEKCQCGLDCWLYEEDMRMEPAVIKTVKTLYKLLPGAFERLVIRYSLRPENPRYEDLATICLA